MFYSQVMTFGITSPLFFPFFFLFFMPVYTDGGTDGAEDSFYSIFYQEEEVRDRREELFEDEREGNEIRWMWNCVKVFLHKKSRRIWGERVKNSITDSDSPVLWANYGNSGHLLLTCAARMVYSRPPTHCRKITFIYIVLFLFAIWLIAGWGTELLSKWWRKVCFVSRVPGGRLMLTSEA